MYANASDPPAAKQERFRFREIIQTILRNDQLVWIAIIFLLQQIGNGLIVGGLGSTYIYLTFGYEGGLYSLFTMVGMSATAFLMVFYPAISRKCPRKQLMSIMAIIAVIGYAFLLISGFLAKTGTLGFALLVLGYMLSNFGQYCYYLIMMITILNTVEYNEYKFGTRDEAVIASPLPIHHKACLRTDCCPDICNLSAVRRYQLHQPDFFAGAAVHPGVDYRK